MEDDPSFIDCDNLDLFQDGGYEDANTNNGGKRKIKRWTEEEHSKLVYYVGQYGEDACWAQISEHIPGRTGKQCRERWVNHIGPNIKKGNWTDEEEDTISRLHAQWGPAWTRLAAELGGRTENSVKNHFNALLRSKRLEDKRCSVLANYVYLIRDRATQGEAAYQQAVVMTQEAREANPAGVLALRRRANSYVDASMTQGYTSSPRTTSAQLDSFGNPNLPQLRISGNLSNSQLQLGMMASTPMSGMNSMHQLPQFVDALTPEQAAAQVAAAAVLKGSIPMEHDRSTSGQFLDMMDCNAMVASALPVNIKQELVSHHSMSASVDGTERAAIRGRRQPRAASTRREARHSHACSAPRAPGSAHTSSGQVHLGPQAMDQRQSHSDLQWALFPSSSQLDIEGSLMGDSVAQHYTPAATHSGFSDGQASGYQSPYASSATAKAVAAARMVLQPGLQEEAFDCCDKSTNQLPLSDASLFDYPTTSDPGSQQLDLDLTALTTGKSIFGPCGDLYTAKGMNQDATHLIDMMSQRQYDIMAFPMMHGGNAMSPDGTQSTAVNTGTWGSHHPTDSQVDTTTQPQVQSSEAKQQGGGDNAPGGAGNTDNQHTSTSTQRQAQQGRQRESSSACGKSADPSDKSTQELTDPLSTNPETGTAQAGDCAGTSANSLTLGMQDLMNPLPVPSVFASQANADLLGSPPVSPTSRAAAPALGASLFSNLPSAAQLDAFLGLDASHHEPAIVGRMSGLSLDGLLTSPLSVREPSSSNLNYRFSNTRLGHDSLLNTSLSQLIFTPNSNLSTAQLALGDRLSLRRASLVHRSKTSAGGAAMKTTSENRQGGQDELGLTLTKPLQIRTRRTGAASKSGGGAGLDLGSDGGAKSGGVPLFSDGTGGGASDMGSPRAVGEMFLNWTQEPTTPTALLLNPLSAAQASISFSQLGMAMLHDGQNIHKLGSHGGLNDSLGQASPHAPSPGPMMMPFGQAGSQSQQQQSPAVQQPPPPFSRPPPLNMESLLKSSIGGGLSGLGSGPGSGTMSVGGAGGTSNLFNPMMSPTALGGVPMTQIPTSPNFVPNQAIMPQGMKQIDVPPPEAMGSLDIVFDDEDSNDHTGGMLGQLQQQTPQRQQLQPMGVPGLMQDIMVQSPSVANGMGNMMSSNNNSGNNMGMNMNMVNVSPSMNQYMMPSQQQQVQQGNLGALGLGSPMSAMAGSTHRQGFNPISQSPMMNTSMGGRAGGGFVPGDGQQQQQLGSPCIAVGAMSDVLPVNTNTPWSTPRRGPASTPLDDMASPAGGRNDMMWAAGSMSVSGSACKRTSTQIWGDAYSPGHSNAKRSTLNPNNSPGGPDTDVGMDPSKHMTLAQRRVAAWNRIDPVRCTSEPGLLTGSGGAGQHDPTAQRLSNDSSGTPHVPPMVVTELNQSSVQSSPMPGSGRRFNPAFRGMIPEMGMLGPGGLPVQLPMQHNPHDRIMMSDAMRQQSLPNPRTLGLNLGMFPSGNLDMMGNGLVLGNNNNNNMQMHGGMGVQAMQGMMQLQQQLLQQQQQQQQQHLSHSMGGMMPGNFHPGAMRASSMQRGSKLANSTNWGDIQMGSDLGFGDVSTGGMHMPQ